MKCALSRSLQITLPVRECRWWLTRVWIQIKRHVREIAKLTKAVHRRLPIIHQIKTTYRLFLAKCFPKILRASNNQPVSASILHTFKCTALPKAENDSVIISINSTYFFQPAVSVIIPTYNGKELLKEYLPSLIAAIDLYPGDSEVIIVENGSTDESVPFLNQNYPAVRILKNLVNKGFGPAVNRGVSEAKYDIVLLLNNDMRVENDFIAPLVKYFDDPAIFAVVSKSLIKHMDRVINETVTLPGFGGGLIFSNQPFVGEKAIDDIKNPCTNFYACGGCSAYDRNKFMKLGGFDDIYHPFYYEDVDLSYQAWKRGWIVLYEPNSIVHHRSHATSLVVATQSYIKRIEVRNRFILTWKNISDPVFVVTHITWILCLFIKSIRSSKSNERYLMLIMLSAMRRLPAIIHYRIKNAKHSKLSDSQIFHLAANRNITNLKFD